MARKFVTPSASPKAHDADGETLDLSTFTAIRAEDADAIAHIKAGLVHFYQPANSEEFFAIERLALARHSLLRAYRMESGLISYGILKALQTADVPPILGAPEQPAEPPVTIDQENSFWMAAGFCHASSQSHWQFFLRYQAQTERFYRRALEEFELLRRHLGRAPEQPIVDAAPESAAERPPKPEPERPPAPQPITPERQFRVPVPTQPAAVLHRRVSHRRRPARASCVVLRTTVLPAAAKAVPKGSPNAP